MNWDNVQPLMLEHFWMWCSIHDPQLYETIRNLNKNEACGKVFSRPWWQTTRTILRNSERAQRSFFKFRLLGR